MPSIPSPPIRLKIDDLTPASALIDTFQLEVDLTGTASFKITLAQLKNYCAIGSLTWGGITGNPSDQADLIALLNLKAPLANPAFTGTVTGITKAMVGLTLVEDIALSAWGGSPNVTTLGTITTGVWNGSTISDTYISSAATWNTKQNALGFTPENVGNKATSLTSPDNVKFPTTLAVSTALAGKSDTSHTHLLSAITDVTATAAEINYLTGVSSAIQTQINGKQDAIANSDAIAQGSTNLFLLSSERTKLTGIQAGAEVNINPDWNAASGDAQILNKPTTLAGYGITDAQPLDSDLTAIAALATTAFGRAILTQVDALAIRTYIGAGTSSFNGNYNSLSNIPASFTPSSHNQSWTTITGTPTTLAGYGITDAQPLDTDLTAIAALTTTAFGRTFLTQTDSAAARTYIGAGTSSFDGNYNSLSNIPTTFTPSNHNQPWSTITGTPTTLAGYGITDGGGSSFDGNYNSLSNIPTTFTPSSHNQPWSTITGTPTTLSGYGITDAQPFITAGTTAQYYRGDKSFQTLNKEAVGLSLVENTTLSTWTGSSFITTLGTIITGTWNGTAIEDTYISSASVWHSKQNALGFIPENVSNKATSLTSPDNTKYPTTLAVSTALENIVSGGGLTQQQIMRLAL